MSKSFFFKVGIGLIFLAAAVLWLLSVAMPDEFGFFNLSWAIVIAAGGIGALFILRGLFGKTLTYAKKFYIYLGAGLMVIALIVVYPAISVPKNYVWPIIAIIAAAALVLGIIATGGKKWDQGDNHNVGYKNYHQRKKEEEEQAKKDQK